MARSRAAWALQALVWDVSLMPGRRREIRRQVLLAMDAVGLPATLQVTDFITDPNPAREQKQAG